MTMRPGRQVDMSEPACLVAQVLKARAEAFLGEAVDRAVITVPARFGREQRLATLEAGVLAGIERVSLLQVCGVCTSAPVRDASPKRACVPSTLRQSHPPAGACWVPPCSVVGRGTSTCAPWRCLRLAFVVLRRSPWLRCAGTCRGGARERAGAASGRGGSDSCLGLGRRDLRPEPAAVL
jgi:Hsp70 protein